MRMRYAKKNEKEIAIKNWKNNFKDSEEQIEFYFNNIFDYKNYLVLEKDNKIVSSLHENPYILKFNNKEIKTKYIVGVATPPEEQGKGYMRYLIIEMLKKSKKDNFPLVFLSAINPAIYRKYGFEYFSKIETFEFEIDELEDLEFEKEIDIFEVNFENKNKFLEDLIYIYNKNMKIKLSYLVRDKSYFNKLLLECFNEEMKIFISYKNKYPQSYIIFGKYDNQIEVREIFSLDFKSYKNIMKILYSYRDYYNKVKLNSEANSNIEYIFKNQLKIKKSESPFMMMRILKPLDILNFTNIKIKKLKILIVDEIIKNNTGLYSFNGKEWEHLTISENYDFKINIADLVQLLTGFFNFDEMLFMRKIELKKDTKIENKKLREVFKNKQNYLYEFQ